MLSHVAVWRKGALSFWLMGLTPAKLSPIILSSFTKVQMTHFDSEHLGGCLDAWSARLRLDPGRCSSLTGYDDRAERNVEILGFVENFPWRSLLHANTVGILSVSCVVV